MNWEPLVAVGVALIGLVGVWIQRQGAPGRDRRRLKADAELLALLPADSEARRLLEDFVKTEVERLVTEGRRSRVGRVAAVIFAALGGFLFFAVPGIALVWLANDWGGWWWIGGVYGLGAIGLGLATAADEAADALKGYRTDGPGEVDNGDEGERTEDDPNDER